MPVHEYKKIQLSKVNWIQCNISRFKVNIKANNNNISFLKDKSIIYAGFYVKLQSPFWVYARTQTLTKLVFLAC